MKTLVRGLPLRGTRLVLAATLLPLVAASSGATATTLPLSRVSSTHTWALSSDPLLAEIQAHFHGARKWFGMVADLQHQVGADGSITPRFETLASKFVLAHDPAGQTLHAHLPAQAGDPHVVELDGIAGFSVRTREVGMQPAAAELHQGVVAYRNAVAGGDLLYKVTPTHVDEYVYLREPPDHLQRTFEYDTGGAVWTLREADTNIEALDKNGVARLRLSAPLARAADGTRRRGTAHLVGRTIVLDIDLKGLAAPILVDPDWSTTGTMTVSHWGDSAWRRPDGRVMAVGGCALTGCPASFNQTACGQVLANSDTWDPATGTWTSGAAMITARTTFAAAALPSGDMVVAGGCTATSCTQMNDAGFCEAQPCTQTTNLAERYSYADSKWVVAGTLSSPRFASMGVPVGTGDALVAGGCDVAACTASVERWTLATNTWTEVAPLPAARGFGTGTVLADGRVLVTGGCADALCATVLDDAVIYDPAANTWTAAGKMSAARAGQTATLMNDGTVLVAGGCSDAACQTVLSSAEIWSAGGAGADAGADAGTAVGGFAMAPQMAGARHHHTATLLTNGEVLMAGGADSTGSSIPTSEVYLPLAHQWVGTSALYMSRAFHIGVPLSDGRVLVSGGCNPQTCIPFAEIFSPAGLPSDSDAGVDAGVLTPPTDAGGDGGGTDAGPAPPATSPHPPLYRTGVVTCSTDSTQDLTCPQAGWGLQDGDFQPNTQAFSKTADDEVTDKTTGLIWQRGDDGQMYTAADAATHCSGFKSAEATTGWRLPSVIELMTLIDDGVDLPSIDPSFMGAQSNNYWTSSPTATTGMLAWTVKFDFGEVVPLLTDTTLPVRCVRGTSSVLNVGAAGLRKAGPLKATTDTVQDATTKLEWQRADDSVRRTWKDSLDYCANLSLGGLSGWHLPNQSELSSLVQYDTPTNGVAIDAAFQSPKGDLYWTSSQNEGIPTLSWTVTFNLGVIDGISVSGLGYARCVRHLESSSSSGCSCQVPGTPATGAALSISTLAGLAVLLQLSRARRRRRSRRAPPRSETRPGRSDG
jgi:Protein of unknown function (DUF1566)/Galactose oxidase, central domain/Kelch motif